MVTEMDEWMVIEVDGWSSYLEAICLLHVTPLRKAIFMLQLLKFPGRKQK